MDAVVLEKRKFTKFREITQRNGTPFKVIDFGTNRKLIHDFQLVINTNLGLPPILHRFQAMADY